MVVKKKEITEFYLVDENNQKHKVQVDENGNYQVFQEVNIRLSQCGLQILKKASPGLTSSRVTYHDPASDAEIDRQEFLRIYKNCNNFIAEETKGFKSFTAVFIINGCEE